MGTPPRRTSLAPERRVRAPRRGPHVASSPVSRILYRPEGRRRPSIWARRCRSGSCGLPGMNRADRPIPAWPCSRWGLPSRCDHPQRWWSLTPPFHPCLCPRAIGGLLSAALSVGFPRLGVTQHRVLWSPDFPRCSKHRGRPANSCSAWSRGMCSVKSGFDLLRQPGRRSFDPIVGQHSAQGPHHQCDQSTGRQSHQ